jgi:hypothetical protein
VAEWILIDSDDGAIEQDGFGVGVSADM